MRVLYIKARFSARARELVGRRRQDSDVLTSSLVERWLFLVAEYRNFVCFSLFCSMNVEEKRQRRCVRASERYCCCYSLRKI